MANQTYYTVEEVQELLGVKQTRAYNIIRELNNQLKAKGYITIAGKISKKYFHEKYYADMQE